MDTSLAKKVQHHESVCVSPDDFFFMSPYRSFISSGCAVRLDEPAFDGAQLDGVFQRALGNAFVQAKAMGVAHPVVVGAIPFDARQPSALFIPEHVEMISRTACQQAALQQASAAPLHVTTCTAIPERPEFESMVQHAATLCGTTQVDKVVISRLIEMTTVESPDSSVLLNRLIAQNPGSFNFHVPLPNGDILLGASPELLLRKQGDAFSSLPLAGSARRNKDASLDRDAGERLLQSEKDRHEHALVTAAMKNVLAPRSRELLLPDVPQLITTSTLWHLSTPIEGSVKSSDENALSLACLLHPTPALSGFPHDVATALISELEPFERDLFGGIVGWCDEEGNGEWVVTIRCARINENQVRLFAGAGIVLASSPEDEWNETGTKLSTMLNVLGLN